MDEVWKKNFFTKGKIKTAKPENETFELKY